MTQIKFRAPAQFNMTSAISFASEIECAADADEYLIDFGAVRLVEPFPMLLISSELRKLARRYCAPAIDCANFEHMSYAAHMGFFQSFDLEYGNAPGEARGNGNYLPIKIYETKRVESEAFANGVEVGDQIESISRRMSIVLSGEDSGDLFDTLTYSIREIIRNVVEHSAAERFGICAQYWPTRERVEVAILDRGIGLRESLSRNPHIDVSDHKKAINFALMPAVSGKAFKGSRTKRRGNWGNSGFGLYMTNRICRNGGNFFIASGDTGMLLTKGQGKRYFTCSLDGTAVRMVINTSELKGLRESLDRYKDEGFEFQKKYAEIVNIDPSSASLMLSEDFEVSTVDRILKKLKLG
jgi:hypothetical protein